MRKFYQTHRLHIVYKVTESNVAPTQEKEAGTITKHWSTSSNRLSVKPTSNGSAKPPVNQQLSELKAAQKTKTSQPTGKNITTTIYALRAAPYIPLGGRVIDSSAPRSSSVSRPIRLRWRQQPMGAAAVTLP